MAALLFMTSICSLIIHQLVQQDQFVSATIGQQCNYDRYSTGCYNQANLVCDEHSDTCKCHSDFPVQIDQRICVRSAKSNEICQYNEQCDNSNGLYCAYSDFRVVNLANLPALGHKDSQQQNVNSQQTSSARLVSFHQTHTSTTRDHSYPRCRYIELQDSSNTNNNNRNNHKNNKDDSYYLRNKSSLSSPGLTRGPAKSNHHSSLPKILWIFLGICLLGLIFLFFMVKSQYSYRDRRRSLSVSTNDSDIPPPYEVAIRMKF